ncbi:hypothetical protein ACWERF_11510 [Streptomyces griseoluteus]
MIEQMNEQGYELTSPETQLFCYLACLLALYGGQPVADWGYDFAATPSIAPFSADCVDAIDLLTLQRFMHEEEGTLRTTQRGKAQLARWSGLSLFKSRIPYLEGATGAATALPVAAVGHGLAQEPQIMRATRLHDSRPLLEEVGLSGVYEQFKALESALGASVPDFMVPAVVWLSYLLKQDSAPGGHS